MSESDASSGSSGALDEVKYDVNVEETDGGSADACTLVHDADGVAPCNDHAPPGSFEPEVQWAWHGQDGETQVVTTPVVANLTDDNGDGRIDLCDIPDVVVVAYAGAAIDNVEGHLYVLDGATGAVHFRFPEPVINRATPALGDIDGDGFVEIVTVTWQHDNAGDGRSRLVAINHDGSLLWKGDTDFGLWCDPSLADADNDGDVEILCQNFSDHEGKALWEVSTGVMADLDGDQDLEVVSGGRAFHHDGTMVFDSGLWGVQDLAVVNLDEDDDPEILGVFAGTQGLAIIEHDGTVTRLEEQLNTSRPISIHDVDADGVPDLLIPYPNRYDVLTPGFAVKWSKSVSETSGFAGSTAFDFLGDGSAEAIYADETTLFAWEGQAGVVQMTSPRSSWTYREYPTVVDVDNDGSAEIIVVSNVGYGGQTAPAVQVIRDVEDRWVPARRIWNQHSYHVTNVREDGSIPQYEAPHWKTFNTFRTQAQIATQGGGGACIPEPAG